MIIRFVLICLIGFSLAALAGESTPTTDFVDNGDGTVTHKKTGLTWMRCSMGQTWTGTGCSGTVQSLTYYPAQASTQDFAGHDDWRLPTITELHGIVEDGRSNPAINTDIFPDTPTTVWFWSATADAGNPGKTWLVNFYQGNDDLYDNDFINHTVRFVRGGQSSGTAFTATDAFTDNHNGTVTHQKTGLTWMQCAMGQTWSNAACAGSPITYTWLDAMALTSVFAGASDWRLPSKAELLSIVDYSRYSPAINTEVFPDAPSNVFWTSTIYAYNAYYAWSVIFDNGSDSNDSRTNRLAVRLVRGVQSPAVLGGVNLTAKLSESADPVKSGANLTYTAMVKNKGQADASGVLLRFYLPKKLELVSAPADCSKSSSVVTCSIGVVAAREIVKRAVVVKFHKAGGASVTVAVSSNEKDTKPKDNTAHAVTAVVP